MHALEFMTSVYTFTEEWEIFDIESSKMEKRPIWAHFSKFS